MPCYDGREGFTAILCGLTKVLENQNCLEVVLDAVDWKEVGGTEDRI